MRSVNKEFVVTGASTGGPRALVNILSGIPRNISSAIINEIRC